MYLSAQISYYPLTDDYKAPVKDIVKRLELSGLEVHANRMSTQIFGEFEDVMSAFSEIMKWSFETYGKAVFVLSIPIIEIRGFYGAQMVRGLPVLAWLSPSYTSGP
ncbi:MULTISPECIES: YkoF family thiamine/hydroxymethylpyrimidine-binding protein [unclassified Marinobacter]|uniref:YkoF family thiamine/hydroxymethylpyrimidine-binding protein n=1 Tax=unclassified Marinobacter TaxID=83889 RepID=UPI000BFA3BC7|nr:MULTISPECIES: YkoF family thiamine/hydroxymethylpyrimidine-binding protein [unclassified Marinobacter]PFG07860.1 YKOF-related protein [Marinobacter sp. LV10MA510-1]PFG53675.1 YKOF-related protein [Marinobacter sp. LV10R520-4]